METYTPIPLPGATGEVPGLSAPGGVFGGFVVHVTGGAAAVVKFYDSTSASSGTLLGAVELTASGNGSWAVVELHHPIRVANGVWFDLVSGTVEGSVLAA